MFALSWVMVQRGHSAAAAGSRTRPARIGTLPNKTPLMLLGIAAGLIIAAETAALLWSAKLLDELAPSLAAIAGLGAAFFGICNAAVRFPGDRMRSLLGRDAADDRLAGRVDLRLRGAGAVHESFAVSVAAFASVGFGLALLIPTHLRHVGQARAREPRGRA